VLHWSSNASPNIEFCDDCDMKIKHSSQREEILSEETLETVVHDFEGNLHLVKLSVFIVKNTLIS